MRSTMIVGVTKARSSRATNCPIKTVRSPVAGGLVRFIPPAVKPSQQRRDTAQKDNTKYGSRI
ncbi:hypothetical protein AUEXF2481DRAFT_39758 [Aureobasidium subglaciale EXF-2481]|uniref:Uncharacterized protein n=1 Tax=Aureobasidium subglaciale (strain EXF-2481) TaxID=1043005 RepID=A0A074Z8T2_AURSE|nr:uncharacterized protein AUEXF2481DRAFT_39758 [Aureobasidium subglaciale EXF-2481]KEQ95226.1 hypothetical protein AUEXF2481DRAFT_39758 [Aureobasidium subglaciale EXF-2481]